MRSKCILEERVAHEANVGLVLICLLGGCAGSEPESLKNRFAAISTTLSSKKGARTAKPSSNKREREREQLERSGLRGSIGGTEEGNICEGNKAWRKSTGRSSKRKK